LITQEYFNDFFLIIKTSNYNSCLSTYSNKYANEIKDFIIKCSEFLKIPSWDPIIVNFTDDQINQIINNQKKIYNCTGFIETAINTDNVIMNYGSRINLINALLSHPAKIKSFENILMSMELGQFSRFLNKMIKTNSVSLDNSMVKYINYQKQNLKLGLNKEIGIKIINYFINKPQIIKNIYGIISESLNQNQKTDIFNKSITTYDKDLIFLILENKDIIPDINTINKLVEKCYVRPEGCFNAKMIADIIDLLCEYGLIITKSIVSKLIDHGCYVNNLEKHGVSIDGELLAKCANHSYYPYKFEIKPGIDVLIKECSKHDNLGTIKKLKEFGGEYTTECLEEACSVSKNGRVIKYLVNECGVKVSDKCLEKFQEAYKIEALEVLMKKYKIQNPDYCKTNQNESRILELDVNSIMTVTPRDIKINKDDNLIEYDVKGKIKKFFELKKKSIKYLDLYQTVLKYLISNKLVIGNYFVINDKLSNLLKINYCTIIHVDQLHNILTYFIDVKN
jgi:RNA binding exosome subunit